MVKHSRYTPNVDQIDQGVMPCKYAICKFLLKCLMAGMAGIDFDAKPSEE